MSHKGYGFESEIEDFFLKLTGQTKKDPILKSDKKGMITLNRTFRVPTSGAMDSMKGDIITAIKWLPKQLKVECKARFSKQKKEGQVIFVEKEWIKKNEQEAKDDNQVPLLVFSFKRAQHNRIWWIIREKDFTSYFDPIVRARKLYPKQNGALKFIYNKMTNLGGFPYYFYEDNGKRYLLIPHSYFSKVVEALKK